MTGAKRRITESPAISPAAAVDPATSKAVGPAANASPASSPASSPEAGPSESTATGPAADQAETDKRSKAAKRPAKKRPSDSATGASPPKKTTTGILAGEHRPGRDAGTHEWTFPDGRGYGFAFKPARPSVLFYRLEAGETFDEGLTDHVEYTRKLWLWWRHHFSTHPTRPMVSMIDALFEEAQSRPASSVERDGESLSERSALARLLHRDMLTREWKVSDGRTAGYVFRPSGPSVLYYTLAAGESFTEGVTKHAEFSPDAWATCRDLFTFGPAPDAASRIDALFKLTEAVSRYDSVRRQLGPEGQKTD